MLLFTASLFYHTYKVLSITKYIVKCQERKDKHFEINSSIATRRNTHREIPRLLAAFILSARSYFLKQACIK